MAENNSSAPLKTAEGAVHQLLIALRTIAAYPVTNLLMNVDAANMQRIAVRALEAQAEPAAVAVPEFDEWITREYPHLGPIEEGVNIAREAWHAGRAALAATTALPATEDSSAGDLATESGSVLEGGTPGPWRVRKRERDGELLDCFVEAPDCQGLPYSAEILGDDEYREGVARKLADCELIVKAVNAWRAGTAQAEVQAEPVSSDPVAWHSKLYGTCWMHKQPYHLDAGTHFFVRGNPNPVATVLSGAAIQWHTGTAAFEHGTFFYTAPQAKPADALDAETIKKAARYDWLRAQGMIMDDSGHPNFWRCMALLGGTFSGGESADDTIDAAMAAAQEGGK